MNSADTAADDRTNQVRSMVLGICQQALLMRLPAASEELFAKWLAKPAAAPLNARRTIKRILVIQELRNRISYVWETQDSLAPVRAHAETPKTHDAVFKALTVTQGYAEGRYWMAPVKLGDLKAEDLDFDGSRILIFHHAHPKSVALFEKAKGLVFLEGGLLSHACSIARERGIPAITAVERNGELLSILQTRKPEKLELNATAGSIKVLPKEIQLPTL